LLVAVRLQILFLYLVLTYMCAADGILRLWSFGQICQPYNAISDPIKMSDKPLDGYILSLHVVSNFRTKERYIFGGADDGSVAIWNSKYIY